MGRTPVGREGSAEGGGDRSRRAGGAGDHPARPGGAAGAPSTARERAQAAGERARGRVEERAERARLTFRRLAGLDRSGPPPPETMPGQPWRPWTIPNAIGAGRLALIPVFLLLAFSTQDGVAAAPAIIFAVIAWSDYADGIAARITGQYSRLGALLDPLVDRLLVVAGFVVCLSFELLPRWAIAALVLRELVMLAGSRVWLRKGLEWKINWPGRLAVWPTMAAVFFALVGLTTLGAVLLYLGLALSWLAFALYIQAGTRQLRAREASS
ncbi:MAG: CDP-alcohol phosphatidyltransferase family protein [Solirubrobacteraceae bacterium MAG38_C4-C5]|nr:CDP-alcohol phosphatidyltransferase family protein [Candidatus Siliceabacter maunaloa]